VFVSFGAWSNTWEGQWQGNRLLFWLDLTIGVAAFALSFYRRRWPFAIALVIAALGSVSATASGPGMLTAASLATRRQLSRILALGAVAVVSGQAYVDVQPVDHDKPAYFDFAVNLVVTATILAWGMYIGSRRELLWTLRDRIRSAESEQELRMSGARATERTRIAREMHDVLAHRISQVSMQAGAMAYREDLTADELRAGAQLIQTQAHHALTELRGVLGVLRSEETGEILDRPQPTYSDIASLIEESREAGMNIDFHDHVDADADMPLSAGRTIFRIVQEGLTNANKHAHSALVTIELKGTPDNGIDVVVRNGIGFSGTSPAPGSGLGLIGLAERAALQGGRLEHRQDGSTFTLHGWIPWVA
jgi:signal transduction histidine kinase